MKAEIVKAWKKLEKENSPSFEEFVKVFYSFNDISTLLLMKTIVDSEENVVMRASDIDTESGKQNSYVNNGVLTILADFSESDLAEDALELFLEYYLKRPDLYTDFFHSVTHGYGISKYTAIDDFQSIQRFFKQMKHFGENNTQEHILILFLDLAKYFLSLTFQQTEQGRSDTINWYDISLYETEGSKEYRKIIWEWLEELVNFPEHQEKIRAILYSYNCRNEVSYSLAVFDSIYIQRIMKAVFPPNQFGNSLLAKHLSYAYQFNEDICKYYSCYFETEVYSNYTLLKGPSYCRDISYEERVKLKSKSIGEYVEKLDFEQFKPVIDGYLEIVVHVENNFYEVQEGIRLAFETVYENQKYYYVAAINYLATKETKPFLNPEAFISRLFMLISDDEVYEIADSCKGYQRNMWLYGYFHEIPENMICEKHLLQLYDFLQEKSDIEIKESSMRNIDFLDKFKEVDPDVISKASAIILKKSEYSPFIANVYFSLLFNNCHTTPSAVIEKFVGNFDLLARIYLCQIKYDNPDLDGDFLLEIYKVYPTILDGYIDLLSEKHSKLREHNEQLLCFYTLPNYTEIYDKIFVEVLEKTNLYYYKIPELLKSMILHHGRRNDITEKQDNWISHCIRENAKDTKMMNCLFQ